MKIVIFIDWFAPAYKAGGPVQSIVNLVYEPLNGVEYRIICSNKDLGGETLNVQTNTWIRVNKQTEVWYNSHSKKIPNLLRQVSEWKPDAYFINGIYSLYYNFLPLILGKVPRKIISARGMLHWGALSQKSLKKKIYLGIWRLLRIHQKNSFHATNAEEKDFIQKVFGKKTKIFIAPNLPRILTNSHSSQNKKNSLQLISIGLISPMKNYLEVLKSLNYCKENIDYTIYGPIKDAAYWMLCEAIIKELPSNIKVFYRGDLPSSKVEEALNNGHVFILPSKSENFGHAIFEALSAGKPVITSHNTPWNNLKEAKAGFNISVNDYELSKAICFFAKLDNAELAEWSAGAKHYAQNAIDIVSIKKQYQEMFGA